MIVAQIQRIKLKTEIKNIIETAQVEDVFAPAPSKMIVKAFSFHETTN